MVDLNNTQNKLIKNIETTLARIKQAKMPESLKVCQITTADLNSQESIQQIASQLPGKGNHIYWFEVDKPALLTEKFSKKEKEVSYKCARENKNDNSPYVYVGSCTAIKLNDRFKQHCGWGNDHTYSLQLRKWLKDIDLLFTFTYVEIEDTVIIQYLEDQLHMDLKPLFGKPGANNKLIKIK